MRRVPLLTLSAIVLGIASYWIPQPFNFVLAVAGATLVPRDEGIGNTLLFLIVWLISYTAVYNLVI